MLCSPPSPALLCVGVILPVSNPKNFPCTSRRPSPIYSFDFAY
ncbi:hypothetical protein SLEP1_g24613 [Rubroshorea leprosula]|uniref:Uncharacterized protein n=1 Tax=Rubroshorea leprosula TaxID=152421 RepID=A0AAV5JPZ6_9ROSI|nr:hypothetical protein SLEP1_g24613 [Rubroshorea leprosula]